ncbi:putative ATP-binding cassette sub-family A [Danaus plexippus plexippus]|uniref:ATP-binding cassette sub-family A n=1 Tax=Danaus plexippus plexippus TaxID=278856 RepID=A0A212EKX7_DANPL|nr:putative ATP-binding cassette sub-family A [Danaus plexippus plexippus]
MAAPLQARLLLWKDYLIRKRKPITLSGVAWATLVMLSLYVVRINVDNTEYPTCQFAARALPSAGLLNFLQSFICNVNNECNELDKFEEIPAYEKSSFSKLQRELSGVIEEPRALNAVGAMSHAARILSSLANVADNSLLLNITR